MSRREHNGERIIKRHIARKSYQAVGVRQEILSFTGFTTISCKIIEAEPIDKSESIQRYSGR